MDLTHVTPAIVASSGTQPSTPLMCPVCHHPRLSELGKRSGLVTSERLHEEYGRFVKDVDRFDRSIYKCLVCGLKFVYPAYDQADFAALYDQSGYKKAFDEWHPVVDPSAWPHRSEIEGWKQHFKGMQIDLWHRRFLATHYREPLFLDVGCGRGQNLVVFHELGFKVQGIDCCGDLVGFAETHLDFDVKKTAVEEFNPSHTFDCILASHVIEHVSDPEVFLSHLLRLLSAEGTILIETPVRFDSGHEQERFRDIYHTLFFDHFTLSLLGMKLGLQTRCVSNINFTAWGQHLLFVLMRFERNNNLATLEMSRDQLESLRACFDCVSADLSLWGKRYVEQNRLSRLWDFYETNGAWETLKACTRHIVRNLKE